MSLEDLQYQVEATRIRNAIAHFSAAALSGLIAHDGLSENADTRDAMYDLALRVGRDMQAKFHGLPWEEEDE